MLPPYADVEHAAQQIAGVAYRTPVLTSRLGEFWNSMSTLARV
jgi:hypothetical protein